MRRARRKPRKLQLRQRLAQASVGLAQLGGDLRAGQRLRNRSGMRFAQTVQPPEEPADLEELRHTGGSRIDRLARRPRIAGCRGGNAVERGYGDEPAAPRPPRALGGEARFDEQIEERRLEREGERSRRAEEEEAASGG